MGSDSGCQRDSRVRMNETLVIVGPGRLGRSATEILSKAGYPVVLIGRETSIPARGRHLAHRTDREVAAVAQDVPPGVSSCTLRARSMSMFLGLIKRSVRCIH